MKANSTRNLLSLIILFSIVFCMHKGSAQSISYRSAFDVAGGGSFTSEHFIGTQVSSVRGLVFNSDGSKIYIVGDSEVNQYSLTTPYSLAGGVTHDGVFSVSTEDSNPQAITFNPSGTEMLITGWATKSVIKYNLTTPFDITGVVTVDGDTYDFSAQQSNPRGHAFSATGDKMYVYGINFPYDIDQYSLSVNFDIASTVTYDGALDLASNNDTATGIAFSKDGTKLLVIPSALAADAVVQYTLATPYDLTGTVTNDNVSFDLSSEDTNPTGIAFDNVGSKMFITGDGGNDLFEYLLNPGTITENVSNDGSFSNSVGIQIEGETFTSAGSTLTNITDYTISTLPAGLSPLMTVAADGLSVALSLTGNATSHQDINDVADLTFTFNNSAFTGGNAAAVANATAASSGISIDFKQNSPVITYGNVFDILNDVSQDGSISISNEETAPQGMAFSSDGMKMYVVGSEAAEVNQYSLSVPFDLTAGIISDGTPLDLSGVAALPSDIAFSDDGARMFMVDNLGAQIDQYTLTTPWDITGTVTYSGIPFSISTEETRPTGVAFGSKGTKMFIVGHNGDEINQYSLSTPYDVTSGVTFDGTPFNVAGQDFNPQGIAFNSKGTEMYMTGTSSDHMSVYTLNAPFDITAGVTFLNRIFNITTDPTGMIFNPTGNKFYVVSDGTNGILQFDLGEIGQLEEIRGGDGSSDGTLHGTFPICIIDDQFANAGGNLTFGADYSISNLPTGLVSQFSVAGDGLSATFSVSGKAVSHQNVHDVSGLIFTFENSAFEGNDVSNVTNATSANSHVGIDFESDKKILYQSVFDLSSGATFSTNESIATEETTATDLVFGANGMKVYVIGQQADEINQYSLVTAYDVSYGLTHEGSYSVTTEEASPISFTFNNDGTKFYVTGTSADRIHQYSLSIPYDITSTVSLEGNYFIGSNPGALTFNNDGTRFYVPRNDGRILQVDLSNAFDVTTGTVSLAGSSVTQFSPRDFLFANDGMELFVLSPTVEIEHYSLSSAYDVTSTITKIGEDFSVSLQENNAQGFGISPVGNRLFVIGTTGDDINQFELNTPSYSEVTANNGALIDSFRGFGLTGETFTNPGGTLVFNTDYQISNLPSGLTPVLEVSTTGRSASLSFTGSATSNQNSDDVAGLEFTFSNSAFAGGNASSVSGATGANSEIVIDFRSNSTPIVTYGNLPNVSGATVNSSVLDISSEATNSGDLAFSNDGTKLFIVDNQTDNVFEYTLTTPFDVTSGATYSGNSYSVNADEGIAGGIAFSPDGLKMFICGSSNDAVIQYSLSSAFDITSTVVNQGAFSVVVETAAPQGISFSPDGRTMLVSGPDLYEYSLTNPFDVTTGVTFMGTFDQAQTIHSAVFGPDGTQILYTNSSRILGIYDLEIPYHLSNVVGGSSISVLSQDNSHVGVTYSPDRKKIFTVGTANDNVYQYAISPDKFEESFNDNGTISNSIDLRVIDDQFNNATASLTQGIHYSVTGLPAGLSSSIAVAADGLTGELTLTGSASSSSVADNVSNLQFTFNNSAFKNSNAADVINAVAADSYFSIDFKEVNGAIFGSDSYKLTGLTFDNNPVSIAAQTDSPRGMLFNNDGTKMLLADVAGGAIIQYTLTTPYVVSAGLSVDGTPLVVSGQETIPTGMAFNNDGTKLYLIGGGNDKLHQYSLGTPYDINGTVTHEGDFAFSNGLGVTFSSDGSRLFITTAAVIYQYSMNAPFDITQGAGLITSTSTSGSNTYSPKFSPDGMELFTLSASHRNIYRFSLISAFDVTDGLSVTESFNVTSQDTTPGGMEISPDGKTFYVVGLIGDDINVYQLPGISFSEVSANSGAVDGNYVFNLVGDAFVNANGSLIAGSHFTITGLQSGLSGSIAVSADASTATLSITGNATDHQDIDDASIDLQIAFLDAAFASGDASSVTNSAVSLATDIDFDDNGSINYTSTAFTETYLNEGQVEGSMTITISNETFTNGGSNLALGSDYNITGVPSGLNPQLAVAANGLSATLTFTGAADSHQESNNASDLVFTFENSAFSTYEAQNVFNSTAASSGSTIIFDDNNPTISYGTRMDLVGNNPPLSASFSVVNEDDGPGGMAFSSDGLKMFMVGFTNDELFEYTLTNPFDVSSGVTYSGNSFDVSGVTSSPGDVFFNSDGLKMYIMDGGSDEVEQYALSVPYDLSTLSHEGSFDVASQDIQPAAITFGRNGRKMYMIGSFNHEVHQYSLSVPYDLTSSVTHDGSPFSVIDRNYTGIGISEDGQKLFVANGPFPGSAAIKQYNFNTPFDITDGMTQVGEFNFGTEGPSDFDVSPDGKKLFVLRAFDDAVLQYNLPIDGFIETDLNEGNISGSLFMSIKDERFTNAGSTLAHGSDYTIDNLPAGLTPTLNVAADGLSATLSLAGTAPDHQDANDVELQFTFSNSAFVAGDASNVANAIAAGSTRYLDFRDNNPALFYGDPFDLGSFAYSGNSFDVSAQDAYPYGVTFSTDGTKLYIVGDDNASVYEYSLSVPFDISSTVVYTGNSLDVNGLADNPEDLRFSNDGLRLFVLSNAHLDESVVQFNLTTAFDLSTAVNSGNEFDVSNQESGPNGLAFSSDGTRMYLTGNNDAVIQYTLSSPFDLTSVTYDGKSKTINEVDALVFSNDGRYLLTVGQDAASRYLLNVPFDVTQGMIDDVISIDYSAQESGAGGVAINPSGSKIFISGTDNGEIHQYDVNIGGFIEKVANDGSVDGSATLYMLDDTFTNAGGTMPLGSAYGINNLPAGLTPTLTVAADGHSATLTLSGSVSSHGNADDIAGLQFSFQNSAFNNYTAAEVNNSINHTSAIGIDYIPYSGNDITSFTFSAIDGSAVIDNGNHTVVATALAGTDISAITPTIAVSTLASVTPNGGVERDFSTTANYTVTAEDGTPQAWAVTITEALATPTDIGLSDLTIDENASTGTPVGTLSSTDASFNDSHTYMLVAGGGDDDNGSFTTVGNELRSTAIFDFEAKDTYFIRIQTDDGNGGLFDKAFTITVNDVNEIPTDLALDNLSIDESNPVGTSIGTFMTTDEDLGQSYIYSLVPGTGSDNNSSFDISGDQLISNEIFDFETKTSYKVRIQTNDQNGGTYEGEFTITINDLPASVTSVNLSNQSIDENATSGTEVGALTTTGEDLSGSFTYSLVSGTGDVDNASFDISVDKLITLESFDFEIKNSYSIRIMSDDGAGNTGAFEFTISVNDVSEAPTDITLNVSSIAENNSLNDVVGSFSTTDVDAGETYTYSLVSGTGDADNTSFDTNGSDLRALEVFDFETKSSYSIRVQTDDGNGGTFEKVFSIDILDQNESILVVNPIADLNLDEGFGTHDVDLINVFTDQDGDDLTYSVSSNNTSVVAVNNAGALLTIVEAGFGSSTITVTADDGSGSTTSDDFVVTVSEVFSTETDITAYSFAEQTGTATIDAFNHTIGLEVANGTDITNLTPTIIVSVGATISPEGAQDFTNPVTYAVTAEDGSTVQDWIVSVTVEQAEVTAIDDSQHDISVYPNPASDWLTIVSPYPSVSSIQLYDLRGVLQMAQQMNRQTRISLQDLDNGLYLLKITDDEITTTTKILIRR